PPLAAGANRRPWVWTPSKSASPSRFPASLGLHPRLRAISLDSLDVLLLALTWYASEQNGPDGLTCRGSLVQVQHRPPLLGARNRRVTRSSGFLLLQTDGAGGTCEELCEAPPRPLAPCSQQVSALHGHPGAYFWTDGPSAPSCS